MIAEVQSEKDHPIYNTGKDQSGIFERGKTLHGVNLSEQERWSKVIKEELKKMEDYWDHSVRLRAFHQIEFRFKNCAIRTCGGEMMVRSPFIQSS